jgi:hypothetical protein
LGQSGALQASPDRVERQPFGAGPVSFHPADFRARVETEFNDIEAAITKVDRQFDLMVDLLTIRLGGLIFIGVAFLATRHVCLG